MTTKIISTWARWVLDSRGNPTICTVVRTENDKMHYSFVPSGASTGSKESLELRDGDSSYHHLKNAFNGKGVQKAIDNITGPIAQALLGKKVTDQREIDQIMIDLDGTDKKSSLGANAILGVSMAVARAGAESENVELFQYIRKMYNPTDEEWRDSVHFYNYSLPTPMFNVLNGGSHAFNSTDFQEFMVVPTGTYQGKFIQFDDMLLCGFEIYNELKKILESKNLPSTVGDEGGFAPPGLSNSDPLELLMEATSKTRWKAGQDVMFALDVAASEFYNADNNCYKLKSENKTMTSKDLISMYEKLSKEFPIYSIEDGLAEDDWEGWKNMTSKIGNKIQLVGDDLFVTQKEFLKRGIEEKAGNSIIIKLNQVGTVSETIDTIVMAHENNFSTIISHRSGETEDTFIADLAVGTNSNQLKAGAPARGERVNKYNRTLLIGDLHLGHLETSKIKSYGIEGYT